MRLSSPTAVSKVSQLMASSLPDLLTVTEPWFTKESGDQSIMGVNRQSRLVCPSGYPVTQKPRNLALGGKQSGDELDVFYKGSIRVTPLTELSDYHTFDLWYDFC